MASGFIGNEVPRKGLRVRAPCPPLRNHRAHFRATRVIVREISAPQELARAEQVVSSEMAPPASAISAFRILRFMKSIQRFR